MYPTTEIKRMDQSLTTAEFNLEMSRRGFITHLVFPPIEVGEQSSNFPKLTAAGLLEPPQDDHWAEDTKANSGRGSFEQDSYQTSRHAWEEPVTDRMVKRYRNEVNAEEVARDRCIDVIARNYEIAGAAKTFDTAVYGNNAVATPWSTKATADPIADVDAQREAFVTQAGMAPNSLVLSESALINMIRTDRLEDLLKYSGEYTMTELARREVLPQLGELLRLQRIVVAGEDAVKLTSKRGQPAAFGRIWDRDKALLARIDASRDLETPAATLGRTIMWSEDDLGLPGADGEGLAIAVDERPDGGVKGKIVRAYSEYDLKSLHTQAGRLLTNLAPAA